MSSRELLRDRDVSFDTSPFPLPEGKEGGKREREVSREGGREGGREGRGREGGKYSSQLTQILHESQSQQK